MLIRVGAFLRSSIGKKSLMALSGLLLIGFLILHVAGNLTLYADGEGRAFQEYAGATHALGAFLWFAEIGLVVLFVAHIALGLRTAMENREARPARYKELAPKGKRTWSSISMIVTGVLVLVFLVIHLLDFRLADGLAEPPPPAELYRLVIERLSSPIGAGIYLVSMVFLGLHLSHGVQSLMQSLGLKHPSYAPAIRNAGIVLSVGIAGLFASFPLFAILFDGKWPWAS
jgi:succinate dehydrogenase / fumarate reductase cytochrome b subunit